MVAPISFKEALQLTRDLITYFNHPISDPILIEWGARFGIQLKNNFAIAVSSIQANCPECMGCVDGQCILGCLIEHRRTSRICYWDEGLRVVGSALPVHEIGHLLFSQAYDTENLENFDELSEQFAQFVEANFIPEIIFNPGEIRFANEDIINWRDDRNIQTMHVDEALEETQRGFVFGLGIGIASSLIAAFIFISRKGLKF